jgi:uncharacterized membrane protein
VVGVVQRVACVLLVLAGLYLAVLADAQPGTQLFGWVIVVVGVLGFVGAMMLPRRGRDR